MKIPILFAVTLLALAVLAQAAPSEINYQGVLTDQQGNPVIGVRSMQIKLYDAPTGGNMTYQETIGNVTVTDGIYSFHFGGNGTSIGGSSGIIDALSISAQPWLELSVDGIAQSPRQKILAVPFALRAIQSETISANESNQLREEIMNLANAVTQSSGITYSTISSRINATGTALGLVTSLGYRWMYGGGELVGIDYTPAGKFILGSTISFSQQNRNHNGYIRYTYTDLTTSERTWSGFIENGVVSYANPYPEKKVRYINATAIAQGGNDGPFALMNSFSAFAGEETSISFTAELVAKKIFINPQVDQTNLTSTFLSVKLQNGSKIDGQWNQWVTIPDASSIATITIAGKLKTPWSVELPSIKIISSK
jgi:hypothetical protein